MPETHATAAPSSPGMVFDSPAAAHTHAYLWPLILPLLPPPPSRILDLGCGNGAFSRHLHHLGYQVTGIDPSPSGIAQARTACPQATFLQRPADPDLAHHLDPFPTIVCLEVIEHLPQPRLLVQTIRHLLAPGGTAIVSTPYHGYWKNLALALTGKLDRHFTALWDGGHVKFWSIPTLTSLFREQNLVPVRILRAGRIPALAKSMILAFRPAAP